MPGSAEPVPGLETYAGDLAAGGHEPPGPGRGRGSANRRSKRGRSAGGTTRRWGGARPKVIYRVDHTAVQRGYAVPGERCDVQVNGARPVPVTLDELHRCLHDDDPVVTLIEHEGIDIRRVVRLAHEPTDLQRAALEAIHDRCADRDCRAYGQLEIDHLVPYGEGGPTVVDNLVPLCGATHDAKTYRGRQLTRIVDSHLVAAQPQDPRPDGSPTGEGDPDG